MKIEEEFEMKRMHHQGRADRLDESLGERRGAESHFRQTLKDRRHESRGMSRKHHDKDRGEKHAMDEKDRKRLHHHMMEAHHKFMAAHHRRKMHKRK